MRIIIHGIGGRMGGLTARAIARGYRGATLVAGIDPTSPADLPGAIPCTPTPDAALPPADVIIDFSHHRATHALLAFARSRRLAAVIATTGHTESELSEIRAASGEIPIFLSANLSRGIYLLCRLIEQTDAAFPDAEVEIIEAHHSHKRDAPGGTALTLLDALCRNHPQRHAVLGRQGSGARTPGEIGVHAIRAGNIPGTHTVLFATPTQHLILTHETTDPALFAMGALDAAAFVLTQPPGLYGMEHLMAVEP